VDVKNKRSAVGHGMRSAEQPNGGAVNGRMPGL